MNANLLLKWLVPGALLAVVLIILKSWFAAAPAPETSERDSLELSTEQAASLGVAGDTPRDTVATLVGQVKAMRSDMLGLKKHNESLQEENRRLRERESNVDSRIQSALGSVTQQVDKDRRHAEAARLKAEEDSRQALQAQLSGLAAKGPELPVGLGLEPGDSAQFGDGMAPDALLWIEPSDLPPAPTGGAAKGFATPALPSGFKALEGSHERGQKQLRGLTEAPPFAESKSARSSERSAGAKPVYTIPQNATLMGSVAMSALIGRVPVDGTVSDPYPFKVLVGADNLTANGIDLPEVAGAVMSGTASGDWTLSCVRGQVESITFVFADGTIRTVPRPQASGNAASIKAANRDRIRGGLGYLSDPYGVPCIAGERRSNAQQYLANQSLISLGGGSAGVSSGTGNSALATILSAGVDDIRAWVNQLYGEAFAAVYVPPAARVALHLDQEITIDYEPNGRSVRHAHTHAFAPDLD